MEHLPLLLLELGQLILKCGSLFLLEWDKRSVGDMVKVWVWCELLCVPPQGQCKGVVLGSWCALPCPQRVSCHYGSWASIRGIANGICGDT